MANRGQLQPVVKSPNPKVNQEPLNDTLIAPTPGNLGEWASRCLRWKYHAKKVQGALNPKQEIPSDCRGKLVWSDSMRRYVPGC